MAKRLENKDIINPNILTTFIERGTKMLEILNEQIVVEKELLKTTGARVKALKAVDLNSFKELSKSIKEVQASYKALSSLEATQIKLSKELSKYDAEQIKNATLKEKTRQEEIKSKTLLLKKDLEAQKVQKQQIDIDIKLAKEKERQIALSKKMEKEAAALNSAFKQEETRLNNLKKAYKDLIITQGGETKASKEQLKAINELSLKLNRIRESLGEYNHKVGQYKSAIREAFAGTGLFNNGLGQLLGTLRALRQAQEENNLSTKKFSNTLKLIATGSAIAAIVAITAGIKELAIASQGVSDKLTKVTDNVKATSTGFLSTFIDRVKEAYGKDGLSGVLGNLPDLFVSAGIAAEKAGDSINKYNDALVASREPLRTLQREIAALVLDQQDLAEFANDASLSEETRLEKLNESFNLQSRINTKNIEAAQIEFDLAKQRADAAKDEVGAKDVLEELIDRQLQAELKLNAAKDAGADLEFQRDKAKKDFQNRDAIQSAELLRSNKTNARSQQAILQQQLSDEKKQLSERRAIAAQIVQIQQETTQAEIDLIQEKARINLTDQQEKELFAEKDEIALAARIKGITQTIVNEKGLNETVGIGVELQQELAKIIKTRQNDEVEAAAQTKKFLDEELATRQRIADIIRQKDISSIEFTTEIQQRSIDDLIEKEEQLFNDLINKDKLYNKATVENREKAIAEIKKLENDLAKEKYRLLIAQYEADKINIENTINDEEEEKEAIAKLDNKLAQDKLRLGADNVKNDELFKLKLKEQEDQLHDKRLQNIQDVLTATIEFSNEVSDREIERLDRSIDNQQRAVEAQQRLQEAGKNNTLANEQKLAAELEVQRRDEQKKKETNALILFYLNAAIEFAKKNPDTANAKALVSTAAAKTAASLLSFDKGTENTFDGSYTGGIDGKGGRLSVLHPDERVFNKIDNAKIGDISNEEAAKVLQDYRNNQTQSGTVAFVDNRGIIGAIKGLEKKLENLEYNVDWDKNGRVIEQVVRQGMTKTTRFMNSKPRL